jgi:hypothetical protein
MCYNRWLHGQSIGDFPCSFTHVPVMFVVPVVFVAAMPSPVGLACILCSIESLVLYKSRVIRKLNIGLSLRSAYRSR